MVNRKSSIKLWLLYCETYCIGALVNLKFSDGSAITEKVKTWTLTTTEKTFQLFDSNSFQSGPTGGASGAIDNLSMISEERRLASVLLKHFKQPGVLTRERFREIYAQTFLDQLERVQHVNTQNFDQSEQTVHITFDQSENNLSLEELKLLHRSLYRVNMTNGETSTAMVERSVNFTQFLCEALQNKTPHSDLQCSYFFDNLTCWPPTLIGTSASVSCPSYVHWINKPDTVKNKCLPNQTWKYRPVGLDEFCTTYGHCHVEECRTRYGGIKKSPRRQLRLRNKTRSVITAVSSKSADDLNVTENDYTTALAVLRYITFAGYVLSLSTTSASLLVFMLLRRLHCSRNFIHMNLLGAFMAKSLLTLIEFGWLLEAGPSIMNGGWPCKTFITFWTYSHLASFSWMLVEALYLHNIIYINVFKENGIKQYTVLGWGAPAVIVILWVMLRIRFDDYRCWASYGNLNYIWVIKAPIVFGFAINFVLLLNIVRQLYVKLRCSPTAELKKFRKIAKSTAMLVVLSGIHYFILTFPQTAIGIERMTIGLLVTLYCELLPLSVQGVFVSFVYCLYNTEVCLELKRKLNVWFLQTRDLPRSQSKTSLSVLLLREYSVRSLGSHHHVNRTSLISHNHVTRPRIQKSPSLPGNSLLTVSSTAPSSGGLLREMNNIFSHAKSGRRHSEKPDLHKVRLEFATSSARTSAAASVQTISTFASCNSTSSPLAMTSAADSTKCNYSNIYDRQRPLASTNHQQSIAFSKAQCDQPITHEEEEFSQISANSSRRSSRPCRSPTQGAATSSDENIDQMRPFLEENCEEATHSYGQLEMVEQFRPSLHKQVSFEYQDYYFNTENSRRSKKNGFLRRILGQFRNSEY